jgi:hypothetical protein
MVVACVTIGDSRTPLPEALPPTPHRTAVGAFAMSGGCTVTDQEPRARADIVANLVYTSDLATAYGHNPNDDPFLTDLYEQTHRRIDALLDELAACDAKAT